VALPPVVPAAGATRAIPAVTTALSAALPLAAATLLPLPAGAGLTLPH
jgi:hypothetical protein